MEARKIYLHIGFGKTGSSSLQGYLSNNPIHTTQTKEKLLYCCFDKDGRVLHGKEVIEKAKNTALRYLASSPNITEVQHLEATKADLDKIFKQGFVPVFSQEDWARRSGDFKKANLFELLDVDVHCIVYVRPQTEWFNSAWWQWFAWDKEFKFNKPKDVLEAWGYGFMHWANMIAQWRRIPRVSTVTVRLHPADTVADFMRILKVDKEQIRTIRSMGYRDNVSLSPTHIKLLLRYPDLRGPHDSDIDCILGTILKFTGRTPWVLDQKLIEQVIAETRSDNLCLLEMLDEESRNIMKNDPRWWDSAAYKEKRCWSEADFRLEEEEMSSILDQAIPTLICLCRRHPSVLEEIG